MEDGGWRKSKGTLILNKQVFLILFFVLPTLAFPQSLSFDQAVRKYIATYHQIAVEEMNLFRIPASKIGRAHV